MAAANSTKLVPVAYIKAHTVYNDPCPVCAKARLSRKYLLGRPCIDCTRKARAAPPAVPKVRPPSFTSHPLHAIWKGMRARCEKSYQTVYRYYGGRGIFVCDEWRNDEGSFIAWAEAHGYAPDLELDRIDSNGPYAPWNCQFISHLANMRKARRTKCTEERARAVKAALASGQSMKAIAETVGLSYSIVRHIKQGECWLDV